MGHSITTWIKFYPILTPTPLEWTKMDRLHTLYPFPRDPIGLYTEPPPPLLINVLTQLLNDTLSIFFLKKTNIGLIKNIFLNPKRLQNSAFASLSPTLDLDVLPNYLIRQLGRTSRSEEGDDILKFESTLLSKLESESKESVNQKCQKYVLFLTFPPCF